MPARPSSLRDKLFRRMTSKKPYTGWTPTDFLDFGNREAVDKALQQLACSREVRRIDRGLYDKSDLNSLPKKPTTPDYRELINVVSR